MQYHKTLTQALLEPVQYLALCHNSSILGLHVQVLHLALCHKSLAQELLALVLHLALCHKWLTQELLVLALYLVQYHSLSTLGVFGLAQYRASYHKSSILGLDARVLHLVQILLQQFQPTQFPKLALQLPVLKSLRFLQFLYQQYNCE